MTAYSLFVCAGVASAGGDDALQVAEPSRGVVYQVGHIYYNAATGERVVTLAGDGQTSGADADDRAVLWSTPVSNPCEAQGFTTDFYYGFDDPSFGTPLSTAITVMDYGDIELDTVVDCIEVNWVVSHPDTDVNGDGVGDGVEELAGEWTLWEPSNGGRGSWCNRLPLMRFMLTNLPGNTPDNQSAGALSSYTMDVDLISGFPGENLSFEIGDSDGDCQTAAFCNNDVDTNSDGIGDGGSVANLDRDFDGLPDSDLDGDGLFDWSWTVRFYQPGSGNDFDSDSDTGMLPGSDSDTIGIDFGFPEGEAIQNSDGTWSWDIDETAQGAGTGEEDRFAIWEGDWFLIGGYSFGGFACEPNPDRGGGYTPPAMFRFALFGPSDADCCPSDYNCDGALDFFDVSQFITDFNGMMPDADINGDGAWDFFDVSQFITAFNAGCP
ncbi:MAG: GC-type dockerin domain-anchored protein [Phycisphaerales bacterium]